VSPLGVYLAAPSVALMNRNRALGSVHDREWFSQFRRNEAGPGTADHLAANDDGQGAERDQDLQHSGSVDELPEFSGSWLEMLPQPLEDRKETLALS